MLRALLVLLAVPCLTAVMAACGADPGDSTLPPPGPAEVLAEWLDAVDRVDAAALAAAAYEPSLALLIAVENDLDAGQVVALAAGGGTDPAGSYWASFARSYAELAPVGVGELVPGAARVVEVDDRTYAAVAVGHEGIEVGDVLLLQTADGRWRVDLLATVGPGLVRPLLTLYAGLPDDEAGETVRDLYRSELSPAFRAAMESGAGSGLPPEFRALVERMILELEDGSR